MSRIQKIITFAFIFIGLACLIQAANYPGDKFGEYLAGTGFVSMVIGAFHNLTARTPPMESRKKLKSQPETYWENSQSKQRTS